MSKTEPQAQISELTRQRDTKLVELASFRNILSPVRRIPVEILPEILELACLPEDGIFHSKHAIALYAHNLSSVCAAWRKVALATPRLWSKLCFDYDNHNKTIGTTEVEWVEEWIDRSRGLPLEVYFSLYRGVPAKFLERILEFRHRIRTLDVAGHTSHTLPFSIYRVLKIKYSDWSCDDLLCCLTLRTLDYLLVLWRFRSCFYRFS